jgi:hypothetical protein
MKAYAHPDLELSGTTLRDTALSIDYILTPDAAWLFRQLARQPDILYVTDTIVHIKGVSKADAQSALYVLLSILDKFGGVRICERSMQERLFGIWTRGFWSRRYPPTVSGFIRGMGWAYGWLLCCLTVPFMAASTVGHTSDPLVWFAVSGLLGLSCVAHEAGHALAACFYGVPYVFLARPVSAAIMYRRPTLRQARHIALFGPFAALVWCGAGAGIARLHMIGYLFLAVGVIHALSLVPFFADGKTVWRKI